ncbi:MAG: hypothetical protein FWF53_01480 [Candidatus Azobacteroides sp.]|nr:hypothetical protein [Candidatus Azobacteroides sp.]
MTFDREFKEAISRLPSAEKDKLIFRLLKKDLHLANRLLFELTADDSKEDKRKEAKKSIENMVSHSRHHIQYSTPGILMMEMRDASGIVNDHVGITKDKYGEVFLQIFVMKEYLQIYNNCFKDFPKEKAHSMNVYLVAKTFKIMVLLKKMHEDLLIDFADDLKKIGHLFSSNPGLMKEAEYNGLNINWLIKYEIPNDIAAIEKDLRQRGYLKK